MNAGPTVVGWTAQGLRGYLEAVAAAVGVPIEATTCELADTITAYLALTRRHSGYPDRDLMLAWGETTGWVLAVETDPGEASLVLGYYGPSRVPAPEHVAQFVTDLLCEARPTHRGPPEVGYPGSDTLDLWLAPYRPSTSPDPSPRGAIHE